MNGDDRNKSPLAVLVSRLALVLALVVGIVPPLAYLAYSYTRITAELEGTLRIQAVALTDFIATQPDNWDVAHDRMLGALDRHLSYEKGFRILKSDGEILAEALSRQRGPFVVRSQTVYSFGLPAGSIEGRESLFETLLAGFVVLCGSFVCAWILWGPIRSLPLAALAEAERDLRAQERYRQALLNNFPFMVWLKDVESRYLAVNSKFLEIAGMRTEEQLIGQSDLGIAPREVEEKFKADDKVVLASGQAKRTEQWVTHEGRRRCLEIYKSPVSLDGEIIGTVGYAQDITLRKEDEEKLTQTLRLLEETQALSRFGGWEYDVEARRMTWSGEVYRLHGVEPGYDVDNFEETLTFYPPDTARLVAQAFRRAVEQGVPYDLDVQFLPRGGSTMWVRLMGTPQFVNGKIACVHGNFMDITEKKNMELELQLANEMLELRVFQRTQELAATNRSINQILSSISSILFVIDPQGRVNQWNTAARSILHKPLADVQGQDFRLLSLGLDAKTLAEGMDKCRQERQPVKVHNLHYQGANGQEGFLAFTLSPILDEQGEFGGVLCLGDDITDLKFLESKLAQAQRLESIGQLAAGIAHEINTPVQFIGDSVSFLLDAFKEIQAILGQCGRLKAVGEGSCAAQAELAGAIARNLREANYDYLQKEIPKSFTRAFEGIDRVTTIVQAMKRFSHPGGPDKRAVDINKAVESTLTVTHNEWKYVADDVTELAPDLPPVVCLPGDLNQVLLNVIVNAAHAIADKVAQTGGRGRITVSTRLEGEDVVIAVSDTGTGIPPAARDKIF
ncbi:MAG TPA: PAS domain S-box protein, partial [Humidesulfovibrio sp.]|uniref:PAS domain-containing sensor histidine kinase n=1 Tax=Humidesulfovibrio sp. TaxID=2910988 RepID=UPI002C703679